MLHRVLGIGRQHKPNGDVEAPDREHVFFRDSDLRLKLEEEEHKRATWLYTILLAYQSLGVIYGDISTASLYVYSVIFTSRSHWGFGGKILKPEVYRQDVLGVFSLLFWTLTVIALLKYALVVLHASDAGEGGTIALYAHLCRVMGISPFGTLRAQTHQQMMAMTSAAKRSSTRHDLGESKQKACLEAAAAAASHHTPDLPWFRSFQPPLGFLVLEGHRIARWFRRTRAAQWTLLLLTMLATGLAIGDGVVMPAFTVVSAVQLLSLVHAASYGLVTGVSVVILMIIFVIQHIGTHRLRITFSPIIILWLLANTALGVYNLHQNGADIFHGLNPAWIFHLFWNQSSDTALNILGAAILVAAGAETMFAGMGSFTAASVGLAFGLFVYPCLVFTYLGQGAFLLKHPKANAFWGSIPEALQWPMFALAIVTVIVACQSSITGAFSLLRQAMALGFFPKSRVIHSNDTLLGRIYIPMVNYTLMLVCICVVVGFGTRSESARNLANAYGVAVMGVMMTTTFLMFVTASVSWNLSILFIMPVFLFYLMIESFFLASTLYKVPTGGWVPLTIALVVFCIMCVWWSGSFRRRKVLLQTSKGPGASVIKVTQENDATAPRHHTLLPSASLLSTEQLQLVSLSITGMGLRADPAFDNLEPSNSDAANNIGQFTPSEAGTTQKSPSLPASVVLAVNTAIAGTNRSPSGRHMPARGSVLEAASATAPFARADTSPLSDTSRQVPATARRTDFVAMMSRPDRPLAQVSGLGLYYGDSPVGMPLVMRHFLKNVDAIHEVCIILIVRFLPMPIVKASERLLVRPVKEMPNFYQVVARYGYQDKVDHSDSFVSKLISTIMFKLELKAGLKYEHLQDGFLHELEGDQPEEQPSSSAESPDDPGVFGLAVIQESYLGEEAKALEEMARWEKDHTFSPVISRYALECLSRIRLVATAPGAAQAAKEALAAATMLLETASLRVVHYRARTFTFTGPGSGLLHRLYNASIGSLFSAMERMTFSDSEAWQMPFERTVELGIAVEI